MLLTEIVKSNDQLLLTEQLGNLDFIDVKFRKALQKFERRKVKADTEEGYTHYHHYTTIHDTLGQNSEIFQIAVKSNADFTRALEQGEGYVVELEGKQVLIVIKIRTKNSNYATDLSFIVGWDAKILNTELEAGYDGIINDIFSTKRHQQSFDPIHVERNVKPATTAKLTAQLLKTAKAAKKALVIKGFTADKAKKDTQTARENNRRGLVPVNPDHAWLKNAQSDLRLRLSAFKANKAVGVDSIDELAAAIREKGFLDDIKIDGWPYKLTDERIRLDYLRKPNEHQYAYLEYSIHEGSDRYRDWDKEYSEIYNKIKGTGTEEEEKAAREALRKQKISEIPCFKFKVKLKLEGGAIVPGEIITSRSQFSFH